MDYTTYWSILDAPSHTTKSNSICLLIAVGFGLIWLLIKKYKKDSGDGDKLILLWGTGVFGVLGLVFYFLLTFVYKDDSDARTLKMLNSPTTPVVEGVVSNFKRRFRNSGRGGGATIESFTVDSVQFSYGDALFSKFNSFAQTYNNVIFDGQRVRIKYSAMTEYDNSHSILRLEIAR